MDEYRALLISGESPAIKGAQVSGLNYIVNDVPYKAIIQIKTDTGWEDIEIGTFDYRIADGDLDSCVLYYETNGKPCVRIEYNGD